MDMLDSLINANTAYSSLSIRMGYTSNIANAGRDFGVEQYGFSGSMSYYHKNGLFADLAGYWNSASAPKYNPTVLSGGYINTFGKDLSYFLTYEHYFYNASDDAEDELIVEYPLTNALSGSGYYDIDPFTVGLEYTFLFGEETAHRIRGNLSGNIRFSNVGFIDRITIIPTAYVLAGDQTLYTLSESYQVQKDDLLKDFLEAYDIRFLKRLRRQDPEAFKQLLREFSKNYVTVTTETESNKSFGVMNYSLNLPILLTAGQFNFTLSYTYNIPVALPGEEADYENNSYISAALIYNIPFK